jgi:tetraacyldisaccharide 4'-kinase
MELANEQIGESLRTVAVERELAICEGSGIETRFGGGGLRHLLLVRHAAPRRNPCKVHRVLGPVRTTVARWLEGGSLSVPLTRALAHAHGVIAARAVARPLRLPTHASGERRFFTVTVGGATLGGSGKTRVAVACARELAKRGARVALIGHAYRSAVRDARVVRVTDALDDVGDEALVCARALAATPEACVLVGPTRQAAVDLAASLVPAIDALVIDGPLQLAPVKASLALLAVDAHVPWGAGVLPPAGDLRAPREALLAAADRVVEVRATPARVLRSHEDGGPVGEVALEAFAASCAGLRVGLFTALARPERLERALAESGFSLTAAVRAPDHGPLTAALARTLAAASDVDVWLATAKCALHLEACPALDLRARVAILDGWLDLPAAVSLALRSAWELPPHCVA